MDPIWKHFKNVFKHKTWECKRFDQNLFTCCSYETSFSTTPFVVWTSVLYDTHASPATALHWLYLSRRGNRHSQWARCHSLDGFSSTHTLLILSDDENIRQGSTKPFPDSTKLLRTQRMERTSYKRILNSCNRILLHSPHGFPYPHQCISMGSTTPIGSTHADPLHCLFSHICFCEIHSNISNNYISRFQKYFWTWPRLQK